MLIKARDLYVEGMTDWSEKIALGTAMGCPTGQVNMGLPRSYSVNSSKSSSNNEDMRELIRAASTRSLGNRTDSDLLQRQVQASKSGSNKKKMPRSFSVGIGRIDEEHACDFEEDDVKVKKNSNLFQRSRSYAVPN
ncbi:hypothetical protein Pint_27864 [Pistacia integerrima]|uniref:Uncharacterized protein n=1 Tax=Pistacia integerrima TaxID=434235 RepID=A0ACC0YRH0_9ROSI|nr:hypothetical protein Pint_27864 [Pistacia integerrima]